MVSKRLKQVYRKMTSGIKHTANYNKNFLGNVDNPVIPDEMQGSRQGKGAVYSRKGELQIHLDTNGVLTARFYIDGRETLMRLSELAEGKYLHIQRFWDKHNTYYAAIVRPTLDDENFPQDSLTLNLMDRIRKGDTDASLLQDLIKKVSQTDVSKSTDELISWDGLKSMISARNARCEELPPCRIIAYAPYSGYRSL